MRDALAREKIQAAELRDLLDQFCSGEFGREMAYERMQRLFVPEFRKGNVELYRTTAALFGELDPRPQAFAKRFFNTLSKDAQVILVKDLDRLFDEPTPRGDMGIAIDRVPAERRYKRRWWACLFG